MFVIELVLKMFGVDLALELKTVACKIQAPENSTELVNVSKKCEKTWCTAQDMIQVVVVWCSAE